MFAIPIEALTLIESFADFSGDHPLLPMVVLVIGMFATTSLFVPLGGHEPRISSPCGRPGPGPDGGESLARISLTRTFPLSDDRQFDLERFALMGDEADSPARRVA